MRIRFICLANSRKLAGRCVAGLRLDCNEWVRPVSDEPDGTLFPRHYVLDDGNEAALLDVIEVNVSKHQPKTYQPENWLLQNEPWKLIKRLNPREVFIHLREVLISGPDLFRNTSDRVSLASIENKPISRSLVLIRPIDISWNITTSTRGKRQTRAIFSLKQTRYNLVVTDPVWEQLLQGLDLGVHQRMPISSVSNSPLLFTISLGEPFENHCYKLIAGIIRIPKS